MKDCSQNLGPRLRHLSNRITQYMDQQFLALDLTSTQSFILHHLVLHEGEQIYPKDIEKRFHLTHPTVSGVLQRLEAKDFVVLEPDRDDRRCKRIRLTERARQCDAAVGQAFETLERVMCSGMSDEEQQTLLRLLDLAVEICTPHRKWRYPIYDQTSFRLHPGIQKADDSDTRVHGGRGRLRMHHPAADSGSH